MRLFHDVSGDVASGEAYQQRWIPNTLAEYPGIVTVRRSVDMGFENGHFPVIDAADALLAEFNAPDEELQERIIYANMLGKRILVAVRFGKTPHKLLDRFPTPPPSRRTSSEPGLSYWIKDNVLHTPDIAVYYDGAKMETREGDRLRNWIRSFDVKTDEDRRRDPELDAEEQRLEKETGIEY